MQNLDSLQFNEQAVIHEEIEAQWLIKNETLVFHSNEFLRRGGNRTQFQLPQQASLVNRFYQPGPFCRWTSIAAPMTSRLRRSAFSYNGCIAPKDSKKDSEGKKGGGLLDLEMPSLSSFPSVSLFCFEPL